MGQLIDTAREAYDLVIIEVPPMAAVVDYKMIARHCDRFVFVVEWGKTSQRMVLECLNEAPTFFEPDGVASSSTRLTRPRSGASSATRASVP